MSLRRHARRVLCWRHFFPDRILGIKYIRQTKMEHRKPGNLGTGFLEDLRLNWEGSFLLRLGGRYIFLELIPAGGDNF